MTAMMQNDKNGLTRFPSVNTATIPFKTIHITKSRVSVSAMNV